MSHTYAIYAGNNPTNEVLASIQLSNSSHEVWQSDAGLSRSLMPRGGTIDQAVQAPFHTTVWDEKPICLDLDEFEEFVDKAADKYAEDADVPAHMQTLWDFAATARAIQSGENFNGEDVYVYVF